jgi:hypothetical protein
VTERARRLLTILLGPLWVRTFRDPVREGRLRLTSLSRTERQLARGALVLLALLLASVLFPEAWRQGSMLQLNGDNALRFLPVAALPIALLGFALGWALLCWGALDASPSVQVFVAVLYAVTGSLLVVTNASGLGLGAWVLEHGPALMRVGYLAVPAALLASALLHPLLRRRPRTAVVVTGLARAVVLVGLLLEYGTLLWAHIESERRGFTVLVPGLVDGQVMQTNAILLPLVYVAAVSVIDFALDVSTSLAEPTRLLRRHWLLAVLVALVLVKLVVQVALKWDEWTAALTYQPVAVARTTVMVVLLVVLVVAVTRFPASDDYALAKERAMYGGSFVLALSYILNLLGVGVAFLFIGQLRSDRADWLVEAGGFYGWMGTEGLAIVSAVAVGVGIVLMRRARGGYGDELGSALVVVGAWCFVQLLVPVLDLELGFSYPTVDLVATLGVLGLVVVRWRSLSHTALTALITVVVFSWLVVSRGDYLSFLGGLVGLPGVLVLVFGVVLTLASGSAFASESSRRLPSGARPLLFVGYLLLSVVLLFWVTVSHEVAQYDDSLTAFFFLGIPMAAWLAGRRIFARPDPVADAEEDARVGAPSGPGEPRAVPEEVGHGAGAAER